MSDMEALIFFGIALFIAWPLAARLFLELFASDGYEIDNGDRFAAAGLDLIACSFWPLMVAIVPMFLLMRTRLFRTRLEREALAEERREAERRELEQLRRQVLEFKIKGGEQL